MIIRQMEKFVIMSRRDNTFVKENEQNLSSVGAKQPNNIITKIKILSIGIYMTKI